MAPLPKAALWPSWAVELDRALASQSQFILSGNVRDQFMIPGEDGPEFRSVLDVLWEMGQFRGYEFMIVYDPVDGARVVPPDKAQAATAATAAGERQDGLRFDQGGRTPRHQTDGRPQPDLKDLPRYMGSLAANGKAAGLFVIDYASRLSLSSQELTEETRAFYVACEKLAQETNQVRSPSGDGAPPFNPVLWLVNRSGDMPDWFVVGNETVRTLLVALPDRATRRERAAALARTFHDYQSISSPERRDELIDQYALLTDGLTLRSLRSIAQLVRAGDFGLERVTDAVRAYKVGAPNDPWKDPMVRQRLKNASAMIGKRVKGQSQAKSAALDLLTRSVLGLSGAQANRSGGRPRGVLFFAGPTGVGKTELAKALTEMLFGDESAYQRFDMSEFSSEHAEARLIGAPPGYVGYDAGGELVNAARSRPFSVFLFDEIEKAHPRILDKFLQILEDGRLTDGRGQTVFFSEAVIIFTSNLGIVVERNGVKQQIVSPGDDYETVKSKVIEAIRQHFRVEISRPELLNRIGDNVVVFNFIEPKVAQEIFAKMLDSILSRLNEEQKVSLELASGVHRALQDHCLFDLSDGGRGIGNALESAFINPLARALFDRDITPGERLRVKSLGQANGIWSLELE